MELHSTHPRGAALALVLSLATLLACGGSSGGGGGGGTGGNSPANITISGQLVSGAVTQAALTYSASSALVTPLAGYKLYCVTFQSPPAAGSATADAAGNVSLTLAANGVAFGCFIRDTSDATVATLSFQSGSTTGTTLTASGDTNIGAVTVDTTTGLASANVSSGTVASTPAGATCPTGYWVVQTGASECDPTTPSTARVWVTPSTAGGYTVTIIHGPSSLHGGGCGFESFGNVPASYSGGKLTVGPFNTHTGSSCPQNLTIVMTPDAACTSASAVGTFVGCGSCGSGDNVCSGNDSSGTCGTATCTATWPGARQ